MQSATFDIRKSNKAYFDTPEHFVVVGDRTVYLRIVGQEGAYTVMTATSGEDVGDSTAVGEQYAMNEAAVAASGQLGLEPVFKIDCHNRPYVEICKCDYLSDAYRAAVFFFGNLMECQVHPSPTEG